MKISWDWLGRSGVVVYNKGWIKYFKHKCSSSGLSPKISKRICTCIMETSNNTVLQYVIKYISNTTRGLKNEQAKKKSYEDRFNCKPNCSSDDGGPPIISLLVTITCFIVHFYYVSLDAEDGYEFQMKWGFMAARNGSSHFTYFTYSFLHLNFEHLTSNMLMLLTTWPLLELGHDSLRPFIVYCFGVIFSCLLAACFQPNIWLIGASGGVFAVSLAFLANLLMNVEEMDRNFLKYKLPLVVLIVLQVVKEGFGAYFREIRPKTSSSGLNLDQNQEETHQVSHMAHIGGAITGLMFGVVVLRNYVIKKWERILRWVLFGVYCVLFFSVCIYWMSK